MSKKHESLLEFYTQVLASVDLTVDDRGQISYAPLGVPEPLPAAVEGKRLVLPTPEALNERGFWEDHTAFHPLSENFLNGESPVQGKLKAGMKLKLGATIAELMGWLVKFAANPEQQATGAVGASASKYLKLVPNIKDITVERIEEIIDRSSGSNDRLFVNLYLKKGGDLIDVRYQWTCVATFPFRQELEGAEPKVFGVKLSQKDQASFKALFDYILPDNDRIETYSAGSKIRSACKFDATLRSFAKIAARLNEVIQKHRKIIPTYKDLTIKLDWVERLGDLDKLADIVPPLPGNEGETARDRRAEGGATMKTPAAATAAKAKRLFGSGQQQAAKPAPVHHRQAEHEETEQTADDQPKLVDVRRTDEARPAESFSERMARMKQGGQQQRNLGYQQDNRFNNPRNYSGTAEQAVPEWALRQEAGKPLTVASNEQPGGGLGDRRGGQFRPDHPTTSFAERFHGGRRGGGTNFGGGGGNFGRGGFQL
jgi:hypothetical protein